MRGNVHLRYDRFGMFVLQCGGLAGNATVQGKKIVACKRDAPKFVRVFCRTVHGMT